MPGTVLGTKKRSDPTRQFPLQIRSLYVNAENKYNDYYVRDDTGFGKK